MPSDSGGTADSFRAQWAIASCERRAEQRDEVPAILNVFAAGQISACAAARTTSVSLRAFEKQILKHYSVVMGLVTGGEHECNRTVTRKHTELLELLGMLPDL